MFLQHKIDVEEIHNKSWCRDKYFCLPCPLPLKNSFSWKTFDCHFRKIGWGKMKIEKEKVEIWIKIRFWKIWEKIIIKNKNSELDWRKFKENLRKL